MAKFYASLPDNLQAFIKEQKIFFVATADVDGRINLSPKGMDSLRVLNGNRILWLNLTGSGNETAAHIKAVNRMTIMFCAFDGKPLILRLYGTARTIHSQDEEWSELYANFTPTIGARQIFDMKLDSAQTSCGFAVPLMDYKKDRQILIDWTEKKSEAELLEYWKDKNEKSIDGKPTGILEGLSL